MRPATLESLLRASRIVFVLAGATAENQALFRRAEREPLARMRSLPIKR